MKAIFATTLFLSLALTSFGQFGGREKELIEIEKKQDSIPRSAFLDSTMIKNLNLVSSGKTRQIWYSTTNEIQEINQFYDIRLKFESKEEALFFHKKYWKENSEFGPEIKKHKIKTTGTDDFRAFKGAESINQMIARYGLQIYCFIFVVDGYFVKFYVSCSKDSKPDIIQPYVDNILGKLKK